VQYEFRDDRLHITRTAEDKLAQFVVEQPRPRPRGTLLSSFPCRPQRGARLPDGRPTGHGGSLTAVLVAKG
jgi:hypothetical protein